MTSTRGAARWLGLVLVVFGLGIALVAVLAVRGCVRGWPLRSDEHVLLFNTAAHLSADGKVWLVPVHGWVFEPETDDAVRAAALATLKKGLHLGASSAEAAVLEARVRGFLVDSQSYKRVVVRVAGVEYAFGPTEADGHFQGTVQVPLDAAARFAKSGVLHIEAVLPAGSVSGTVLMPGPRGTSVISDIDDTIKESQVTDKRALLRNTFLSEFRAVRGMPGLYRRLAAEGAVFHFVSSSPWQLYPPLETFSRAAGFPEASFELRRVHLKGLGALELMSDPTKTKPPAIERLLAAYPGRRFCLMGDSGEKDPEVYGEMARRHPEQVARILIRNVTRETADAPRYRAAFRGVAPGRWQLFTEPQQLSWPE
ncbi:MAG: DUF2183 domain-containing protein [Polyangiaceae bacterium]|nr:DUF2183 domain-containing protein [Polyangiaceae bacterium]